MSKIRCIIIEDEPLAARVLSQYISDVPFLQLEATFKDAMLATDYLRQHPVDLMFIDIHLPKLKGMAFLKTLTHPPAVIITTAYHQYAVEGFNLNVTDYLLKPFDFERFLVAVNKVKAARVEKEDVQPKHEVKDFIFLNVQKKKVKILFSDIIYIESQREYIKIVTTKGEFISRMTTHEIEELLPANNFIRIHRSFIVSVSRIESYTADSLQVNGISLPIGRGYRDVIEKL
jgi:two-component system, LytTR family, response regulator